MTVRVGVRGSRLRVTACAAEVRFTPPSSLSSSSQMPLSKALKEWVRRLDAVLVARATQRMPQSKALEVESSRPLHRCCTPLRPAPTRVHAGDTQLQGRCGGEGDQAVRRARVRRHEARVCQQARASHPLRQPRCVTATRPALACAGLRAHAHPARPQDNSASTLKACERLALSTNQIDRMTSLAGMDSLKILSLSRNMLKKVRRAVGGIEGRAGVLGASARALRCGAVAAAEADAAPTLTPRSSASRTSAARSRSCG